MFQGRMWDRMRHSATALALVAAFGVGTSQALAQDDGPNTGAVSLSAGFDITTQYWFRGLAQENQEFIFQPWVEVGLSLYEGDDASPIDSVGLAFGIWNSWHAGPSGIGNNTGAGPDMWYEADLYVGMAIGFADIFEFGVGYTALTSPNNAFTTVEEIPLSLSVDDSGWWENAGISAPGFEGLQPYVLVALEIDNGADVGPDDGTYFEFGFGPSFTLIDSEDFPVTASIPFTFGFGSNYYEDATGSNDAFGYFDVGLELSTELTFIPAKYGAWSAYVGVHMITLGDNAENIAGPTAGNFNVTGGNSTEVYSTFGISMEY
jgi:hypothetical protein